MDKSWLAVLGFLLIAIAGGLAFVAFKQPAAFRENLAIPLSLLTAVALIVLSFWNLGALHAQSEALLNAVTGQDRAATTTVVSLAEKIRGTYLLQVYGLLIAGAIIGYLLLLSRLPELGLVRERRERTADKPGSDETGIPSGPAPNEPS